MSLRVRMMGRVRSVVATATSLTVLLEELSAHNESECKRRPYPPLILTRVRYRMESTTPGHVEDWLDAREVLRLGYGDCEDLACYEVGRLRAMGVRANPQLEKQRTQGLWHVVVILPDGRTYDPSAQQGMSS